VDGWGVVFIKSEMDKAVEWMQSLPKSNTVSSPTEIILGRCLTGPYVCEVDGPLSMHN